MSFMLPSRGLKYLVQQHKLLENEHLPSVSFFLVSHTSKKLIKTLKI